MARGTGQLDWDEVSRSVSDAYFPHRLSPQVGSVASGARAVGIDLGAVKIARIGWGASVTVETEHTGGVAVNLPTTSGLISRVHGADRMATPELATVYPADTPVRISRWDADCTIIGVRFESDALAREMSRLLERRAQLPGQLDVRTPAGASWLALLQSLSGYTVGTKVINERLAGALTCAFVLAVCPEERAAAIRPRIVKRLLDRMQEDPALAWTAGDMAEVAGVGIRRLQAGFREYVGLTPHEALTDMRLERARADLLAGAPDDTVASIASRWSIGHLGRFARAYRDRYGETPSHTLQTST